MSMTLEQVSAKLREQAEFARGIGWPMTKTKCLELADAIDAHLAQPAQSVAIYPVGHFIETSAGEYARVSRKHECDGDVFQLYRSTGNAQSVDVDYEVTG